MDYERKIRNDYFVALANEYRIADAPAGITEQLEDFQAATPQCDTDCRMKLSVSDQNDEAGNATFTVDCPTRQVASQEAAKASALRCVENQKATRAAFTSYVTAAATVHEAADFGIDELETFMLDEAVA